MMVFAHAGHWAAQLLYLAPVFAMIGALVVGHVAALVLAHDRALEVYGSARAATRSQVVMLMLMVAFTCLGLWLLSAALNA